MGPAEFDVSSARRRVEAAGFKVVPIGYSIAADRSKVLPAGSRIEAIMVEIVPAAPNFVAAHHKVLGAQRNVLSDCGQGRLSTSAER